jgi:predicted nucleic acid-binding protein
MPTLTYLDASALVKLATRETESQVLVNYLQVRSGLVSSRLGAAEFRRVCRRLHLPHADAVVDATLAALTLIDASAALLETAGRLAPPELRTLDAIHLATALSLGPDAVELITYDTRLAAAARKHGLTVRAPR